MADNRFHGLAEGQVTGIGDGCVLRIDGTRAIRSPPPFTDEGSYETKDRVVHKFRAETRGFHFGCISCRFFKEKAETWKNAERSLWVTVDDCRDETGPGFKYCVFESNVTRYFGQTELGIAEAAERNNRET